jgi:hypothetical protein
MHIIMYSKLLLVSTFILSLLPRNIKQFANSSLATIRGAGAYRNKTSLFGYRFSRHSEHQIRDPCDLRKRRICPPDRPPVRPSSVQTLHRSSELSPTISKLVAPLLRHGQLLSSRCSCATSLAHFPLSESENKFLTHLSVLALATPKPLSANPPVIHRGHGKSSQ